MTHYWIFYFFGAFLALALNYLRYVRRMKKEGVSAKRATVEWFLEPTADNAADWGATVAVVWLGGAIYIDRVTFILAGWLATVTLHPAIAFALGYFMELGAPVIIRWIVGKFIPSEGAP